MGWLNRNVFLTALEAGKIWCLVRACFWFIEGCLLTVGCPHMAEGVKELSGVSFIRALIPFLRLHPHDLITFQRPHHLIPSQWGLGYNI